MSRRSWRAELCDAGNNKEKESLAKSAKVAKQEDNHEDHGGHEVTSRTLFPLFQNSTFHVSVAASFFPMSGKTRGIFSSDWIKMKYHTFQECIVTA